MYQYLPCIPYELRSYEGRLFFVGIHGIWVRGHPLNFHEFITDFVGPCFWLASNAMFHYHVLLAQLFEENVALRLQTPP